MHSINLLSLTALVAVVFGIRCLAIPAVESMPRSERVRFMGKFMPRARRLLVLGLIIFTATTLAQLVVADVSSPVGAREVIARMATILAITALVPLTLSPHRSVALKVEQYRKPLLTTALVLLCTLIVLTA